MGQDRGGAGPATRRCLGLEPARSRVHLCSQSCARTCPHTHVRLCLSASFPESSQQKINTHTRRQSQSISSVRMKREDGGDSKVQRTTNWPGIWSEQLPPELHEHNNKQPNGIKISSTDIDNHSPHLHDRLLSITNSNRSCFFKSRKQQRCSTTLAMQFHANHFCYIFLSLGTRKAAVEQGQALWPFQQSVSRLPPNPSNIMTTFFIFGIFHLLAMRYDMGPIRPLAVSKGMPMFLKVVLSTFYTILFIIYDRNYTPKWSSFLQQHRSVLPLVA